MIRCCLFASVLVAGCGVFRTEAVVTSDTSWSGSFDGRTVEGTGNRVVDLPGGGASSSTKCAVVQKQTRQGFLTVRIGSDEKTTTAEFGVVSVCGS